MKTKCPKCATGKARRICPREGNVEICSECCASIRDSECGDCVHYASVRQYEKDRNRIRSLPEGHFIMEVNPEVQAAVDTALQYLEQGRTQKGASLLHGLLAEHPRSYEVAFGIGVLHAVKKEHEKAIEWFDKAIAIYPYGMESHYNKALAYQKMLDVANCIHAYRKVVEIGDPEDPEVGRARSFIASIGAGIWKSDRITLDAYLEAGDLFNQAFKWMEQGEWQAALDGFRASASIHERNAPCQGNIGLCLAYLGRKAEALFALERALEIDPDYQPARSNRVMVEKLEEGGPMPNHAFQAINHALESLDTPDGGRLVR